jgi:hypothetical protein
MTQDEIIEVARQAGLFTHKEVQPEIVAFAKLVAERALAQSKQEPAAWIHIDPDKPKVKFLEWKENEHGYRGKWINKPLYNHPPQRTWVDLSDEDIEECFTVTPDLYLKRHIAQRISAKLKAKNYV